MRRATRRILRFNMLRQQEPIADGRPNRSLADFVAPADSGKRDYVGAFAVTAGIGVEDLVGRFEADLDDYSAIMVKALADRFAEAFAEYLHAQARRDWGYGQDEHLSAEDLAAEKYRGIRPAFGYPACPDHTEKGKLFALLDAGRQGIALTESFAMTPAASVSGLYFANPAARYFMVGRIGADQVKDYAERKGMPLEEVERWLAPNLSYDAQMAVADLLTGWIGWISECGAEAPPHGHSCGGRALALHSDNVFFPSPLRERIANGTVRDGLPGALASGLPVCSEMRGAAGRRGRPGGRRLHGTAQALRPDSDQRAARLAVRGREEPKHRLLAAQGGGAAASVHPELRRAVGRPGRAV